MKLIKPLACYLTLFTFGTCAYAQAHSEWIFGAAKAANFHGKNAKDYYISVASFKNKRNARVLYSSLKKKHIESVHLVSKNNIYNVFVGPLHSADAVRETGIQLSNKHPKAIPNKQVIATTETAKPILTKEPLSSTGNIFTTSSKIVTLTLGASWAESQSVTERLAPEIINTYAGNNNSDAFIIGEIFAGLERELTPGWLGQLGVAVAGGGNADLNGNIWANGEPRFDNFTYTYSINRVYVGLKGKLLKDISSIGLQPYVNGSIGLGFNHAYDYSSTPKIFEEIADQPFGSNVTPTFSYTVGAGIQKTFAANWAVGVGYEFSDWGRSSLSSIVGSTNSDNIVLDHLYNNAVLVNLSYRR